MKMKTSEIDILSADEAAAKAWKLHWDAVEQEEAAKSAWHAALHAATVKYWEGMESGNGGGEGCGE